MIAGRLTEQVVFQVNNSNRDESGGIINAWEDRICTKADVTFSRGSHSNVAGEIVESRSVEMRVRIYHIIDPKMRIVHRGLKYRILSMFPERHTGSWIISAEQINE
ncbi:MAG: phage head closure protein [Tannerellaceae bacterium]|jgi:SPP1 family predicted phage head-tail adaptor|nr:phage head closure protein [Tannerellaceae bacterium]